MLKVAQIIDMLGGRRAVSDELHTPYTTVDHWTKVNFVSRWHRAALLNLADKKGVSLSTADFPTTEQRVPRAEKAA